MRNTPMSLQNVLQQLLGSAQELVNKPSTLSSSSGSKSNSTSALSGFAGGALSGGALALLLGNKKFMRKYVIINFLIIIQEYLYIARRNGKTYYSRCGR